MGFFDNLYNTQPTDQNLSNDENNPISFLQNMALLGGMRQAGLTDSQISDPLNQKFWQRFQKLPPSGPMTLDQLVAYTGGADRGVTKDEFNALNPYVQQQILADPLTFLRGQLGLTNDPNAFLQNTGGSGDLLSIGAEGGVKNLGQVGWQPGVGLVRDPSNYMQVLS